MRIVRTAPEEVALLQELAGGHGPRVLGFVNAHAMNSMISSTPMFDALTNADILLRDGSGMKMLCRWWGHEPGVNLPGTDFIPKILAAFRGRSLALWGTREPVVAAAAVCCEARFGVRVVSQEGGFHDDAFYVRRALEVKPDLILLGMSMPKQERVAHAISSAADVTALIICGGAIVDFLGGRFPRAPKWMRMCGIEWVYRFAREPRRLFKRYVIGNPLFLLRTQAWRPGSRGALLMQDDDALPD
jgi:exopolysaccharide biosynthesis WecB/TagA/CpsF family protein